MMEVSSIEREAIIQKNEAGKERLNLNLFLYGKLVSLLGTNIYSFAMSLYILKETGSGMSFALSIFLGMLPRVILGPVAGSAADRADRKRIVVGLDLLSGTTVLALAGLSSIYGLRIPFIYAVTLMLSIISAFFDTTIVSSIPSLVTNKSLMKINSYSSAVDSISSIGGPLLGGFIFGMVPMNIFLIANGLSFIASAISEMFMDFKFNKSEPAEEGVRERFSFMSVIKDTREVMGFIKGQRLLYAILKGSFIINFFIGAAISVVYPYIVNNIIGMSSTQFGIIEATFSIAFLVTSIVIGKLPERQKMMKRLTACVLLDGLLLGAMGIPALGLKSLVGVNVLFVYYIIVVFIFSVSIVLVNVPLMVYLQRMTPGHILGRVVGVIHTFSGAIGPAGVVIAGALVEIVPAYAMTFISGASVAMVAGGLIRNKALRDL